jgi:hypothetical protein
MNKSGKGEMENRTSKGSIDFATLVGYLIGIVIIGAIFWFLGTAIWGWVKNELFTDRPWLGLYYEDAASSTADEKYFISLEECREWAKGEAEWDKKEGDEWDYSCGYKCEFTKDMLHREPGKTVYDCETITK